LISTGLLRIGYRTNFLSLMIFNIWLFIEMRIPCYRYISFITRILDRFYLNLKFDSHASSLSTCIFTSFEISPSLCVLIHSQPLFLLTRNQPKMRCCFVALKQYFRNVLVSLLFLPSHSFILSSSLRRATMVVLF